MQFRIRVAACAAAVALGATTAGAQVQDDRFLVNPRAGFVRFDRASSLDNSGALGLDVLYNVTPMLSFGAATSISRARTIGEDFLTTFTFGDPTKGDTTLFFAVSQPISVVDYQVIGSARLPQMGRMSPFLTGGIGGYTLYMDQQVSSGNRKFSRMAASVGGGFNFRIGRVTGVQLDVRDLIFTDYNRDRLNPSDARFANTRFPEDVPLPPEKKSTVHNIMVSIGFSFVPTTADEEGAQ